MAAFNPALTGAIQAFFCASLAINERGAALTGGLLSALGQDGLAAGAEQGRQDYDNALQRYCGLPPRDLAGGLPPELQPPFLGGQCSAPYLVTYTYRRGNGSLVTVNNSGPWNGPVAIGPVVPVGGGLLAATIRNFQQSAGGFVNTNLFFSNQGNVNSLAFTNVLRQDGQPDNCGNVPAPPIPPRDPSDWENIPLPVTYDGPDGQPVTITPELTIGPLSVNPSFQLTAPIVVNFSPNGSLFGDINFSTGDIEFNVSNGSGEGPAELVDELPEEEELEGDDRVVLALSVSAVVDVGVSSATEIFQSGGNPGIFVPSLGHVNFRYRMPDGTFRWSEDIRIKNLTQVIFPEVPADGAAWTPQPGVSLTVKRWVALRSTVCCEGPLALLGASSI